jgi:flavin reductase (DIM6/NTAB) family NADH-FMN oxidoreductase RutF
VSSSGSICINVLSSDQEALARTFAKTGADKFAGVGWSPSANGAPRLHGAIAWIDCTIEESRETGDHYLVVARVEELGTGPGHPLLFYRGGFGGFES